MQRLLPVLTLVLNVTSSVAAGETDPDGTKYWPAWRGPLANGVAPHGDPPTEWSETKNIRWKVELPGPGHASPIVWSDRIIWGSRILWGNLAALPLQVTNILID